MCGASSASGQGLLAEFSREGVRLPRCVGFLLLLNRITTDLATYSITHSVLSHRSYRSVHSWVLYVGAHQVAVRALTWLDSHSCASTREGSGFPACTAAGTVLFFTALGLRALGVLGLGLWLLLSCCSWLPEAPAVPCQMGFSNRAVCFLTASEGKRRSSRMDAEALM